MLLGGTSLHFNGDGIRSAVTNPFDARNVEDFTFIFYYGDDCADSNSMGTQVSVALSDDFGVSWNVIKILGKLFHKCSILRAFPFEFYLLCQFCATLKQCRT